MSGIPVLLEGSALSVLVVGGGPVAVRKASAFAAAGASVRVVSREPSPAMRELAREHDFRLDERGYEPADVADAMLVIAATNDRSVNAAIAADGRASSRLVNVADAPDEGSFATMATHRSGTLVVGVSAGGVPGAAARIRDEVAGRFDARYDDALRRLAALRRTMIERGGSAEWRAFASEVLDADFCDAVETGALEARMAAWR